MTISDRIYLYNQWFDRLPLQQQFLAAWWSAWGGLWVLMMLNFFAGVPFLFMVILSLLVVMGPRLMFKFDMLDRSPWTPNRDEGGPTRIAVKGPGWAYRLNAWFDGLSEPARILTVAFATLGVFVLNMILYYLFGFPVGLLVMLAVLILGWARVVHVNGWLVPRDEQGYPAGAHARG